MLIINSSTDFVDQSQHGMKLHEIQGLDGIEADHLLYAHLIIFVLPRSALQSFD